MIEPVAHSQRPSRVRWRLLLAETVAFALVGGSSPQGAELVPFRGTEAQELGLIPMVTEASGGAEKASGDVSVQELLRSGSSSMGRGDLQAAKVAFAKIVEREPQQLAALINLGWIAQREKAWGEAEAYLKKAQHLAPENAPVWLALGVVYLEQNRIDFAQAAFSQVVALEPENARAHRLLGLTFGRKAWYSGAEAELRRSIELEPSDAGAHFNLAVVYLQRQPVALELARRHYHRAVDLGSAPDPSIEALFTANDHPPTGAKVSASR